MKIIVTNTAAWYLHDNVQIHEESSFVSFLEAERSIAPWRKVAREKLSPLPPDSIVIETSEELVDLGYKYKRRWIDKEDFIWMESL